MLFDYDVAKFIKKALFKTIWGVYDNGILVAAAIVDRTAAPDVYDIPAFVVKKDCQGKGYGKILMVRLIKMYTPLTLQVHKDNAAARALYTKMGFIESLSTTHVYNDGSYCIDCILK